MLQRCEGEGEWKSDLHTGRGDSLDYGSHGSDLESFAAGKGGLLGSFVGGLGEGWKGREGVVEAVHFSFLPQQSKLIWARLGIDQLVSQHWTTSTSQAFERNNFFK
jgi:hypothetical protein